MMMGNSRCSRGAGENCERRLPTTGVPHCHCLFNNYFLSCNEEFISKISTPIMYLNVQRVS